MDENFKKLYNQAVRLLARRDWGQRELARRLSLSSPDVDLIQSVIDRLIGVGYLNEDRFIQAYVNMRRQRGMGPLRIAQELRQKGIPEEAFQAHLSFEAEHWQETAQRLKEKKQQQGKTPIQQKRFLLSRGFV